MRDETAVERWEQSFPAAHQIYWQIRAGMEEMDGRPRPAHHRAAVLALHDAFPTKGDRARLGLPTTNRELAELLGVSTRALRKYRYTYAVLFSTTKETIRQSFIDANYGRVMEALVETAVMVGREGTQDRKLFFQMNGDLVDKVELEGGMAHSGLVTHQFQNLSDDELYDTVTIAMATLVTSADGEAGGTDDRAGAAQAE